MSTMVRSQSGADQTAADNEQNNNNNNSLNGGGDNHQTVGSLGQSKKRASVQSNLSAASSANSSASTSQADDDDNESGGDRIQMSNAEYEHIRNKTLLFFLDRLYLASQEGKEARTLHDLSCLFGTREFTKEMRQIVGASRNGLKKFLQSYPSLFEIEGDKVHLTQLKEGAQVTQRDYNKEAVEYFKQKLLQFGSSLVPIKNLFGYRSQANQEVRHVSGKNSRDFKRFLKQNEDVFEILADEHVVLKSALKDLESQGLSSLSLQQSLQPVPADEATTMDPYLNKQLAHQIEDCIRKIMAEQVPPVQEDQFKVTLEHLYDIIQQHCQNELFLKMVKTTEDLRVFLRMHPKIFKRFTPTTQTANKQANDQDEESMASSLNTVSEFYVGLVSDQERRELEAQAYQASSMIQRQHSTLEQQQPSNATTKKDEHNANEAQQVMSEQPASLPVDNSTRRITGSREPIQERVKSIREDKVAPANTSNNNNTVQRQISTGTTSKKRPEDSHDRSAEGFQRQPLQASHSNDRPTHHQVPNNQLASHKLRANAPPFVPSRPQAAGGQHHSYNAIHRQSSLLSQPYRSQHGTNTVSARQQAGPVPIQRSLSNLNQAPVRSHQTGGQFQDHQKRPFDAQPFDQRQQPNRNYQTKSSGSAQQWGPPQHQGSLRGPMVGSNQFGGLNQVQQDARQSQRSVAKPVQTMGSTTGVSHQPGTINQDDLRARTVDIVREASNIITKIMTTTNAVAFDCKGYNLGFDGKITLIQFGFLPEKQMDPMQLATSMNKRFASSAPTSTMMTSEMALNDKENQDQDATKTATTTTNQQKDLPAKPEVCVFDLITNPELAYCLKPLLESDKIVKIVHDVRNKSNALHVQFDITLNNVFDTQVANLVIQQQVTGKPAYKSRYISMGKLCEIYGGDDLVKYRTMIKNKTSSRLGGGSSRGGGMSSSAASSSKDVNYWRTRPLTRAMILEATMDVYCLVGGIYQNLKSQIKPEYQPLFDLLNLEGVLARIKPEEIRSAKKERKIDMEVIDLKRKLYSDTTGPVVLSNREIRLLRHIDLTEGVRQKIQQCKKVAKKLERLDMKAALLKQQQQLDKAGGDGLMSLNSQLSSLNSHSNNSSLSANGANGNSLGGAGQDGIESDHEQRQEQLRARLDAEFNAAVMMMDSSMFDELKDKINESTNFLESLDNDDEEEEAQLSSGHHSHNGSSINDCCRCQCHHSNQHSLQDVTTKQPAQEPAKKDEPAPKEMAKPSDEETAKVAAPLAPTDSQISPSQSGQTSKETTNEGQETLNDKSSKLSDLKPSDNKPQSVAATTAAAEGINKQDSTVGPDGGEESDDSKSSACDMAVQCDLLS